VGFHTAAVRSLAFSPDGNRLASAAEDNTAKVWNVDAGRTWRTTLQGHTSRVNAVAYSPDGSLIATVGDDASLRLRDAVTGLSVLVVRPGTGALASVAFSPDGEYVAVASEVVSLYRLTGRRERRALAGHTFWVPALAFHPTRPELASGGSEQRICLW